MRWMIGILFLLGIALGVAYQIEVPANSSSAAMPSAWRLTPSGWQKIAAYTVPITNPHAENHVGLPLPHPIVLALFLTLLSLLLLVALSPSSKSKARSARAANSPLGSLELRSQSWLNGS
jgi:hypothetical protein